MRLNSFKRLSRKKKRAEKAQSANNSTKVNFDFTLFFLFQQQKPNKE